MAVCVIGLGNVGTPTIKYIHRHGFKVHGYDLVKKSLDGIKTFADWSNTPKADIYVVAVSSDGVEDACEKICEKDENSLVSIESTVRVGTCRKISDKLGLETLVHCPHRYWADDPVNRGVRQLRVMGAINKESLESGLAFYRSLSIPIHVCSTIEVAETCKIAENAYRFVQIAFAEELRRICDEKKIPFKDVRGACNTKWNTEILEARGGIFGTCLPKDIGFLRLLSDNTPLLNGAILTDEIYQKSRKMHKNLEINLL